MAQTEKSLFIAVPSYNETLVAGFASSLMSLSRVLTAERISHGIVRINNSLITWSRNEFVRRFLESTCTHLLFLDTDIEFPAQAVTKMLITNKDLVSVTYPRKDGSGKAVDGGAGMLLITRSILLDVIAHHPELQYRVAEGENVWGYNLFGPIIHPDTKVLMSEDKSFFHLAGQPTVLKFPTTHWGMHGYTLE